MRKSRGEYEPFDESSVYYDDIGEYVTGLIAKHNQIAMIVQGLLDRSEVWVPHPPWNIMEPGGFEQALRLVYDDDRALVSGPPPDFEAYRARCNASLAPGSVTVGQETAWMRLEAERENARRARRSYDRNARELKLYRPEGNPGPGTLARVVSVGKRSGRCSFTWKRMRVAMNRETWQSSRIPCSFTCDASGLLNVSAYKPGDFRQFFADPRTRAEYLKWAPYLLAAEEYHAGNREVAPKGEA